MSYNAIEKEYLEKLLNSETLGYYDGDLYVDCFAKKIDLNDKQLLLKMMDLLINAKNKALTYGIALDREVDIIKNVAQISNVPVNYIGEVESFSKSEFYNLQNRPKPSWSFDARYPEISYFDDRQSSFHFAQSEKGIFSPLSFAVSTKLFPIAHVMISNTKLNINKNHNEKCPHALDFMDKDSVYNGLLLKIINRKDFDITTFQEEILELIHESNQTTDLVEIATVLKILKKLIDDEKVDVSVQKECEVILKKRKSDFIKLI